MKKILVTGGVLFTIMPALAVVKTTNPGGITMIDLTPLIQPRNTGDCSGENFQGDYTAQNPMRMTPVYVTDSCPAGQYFNISDDVYIDPEDGIINNAGCELCTAGYFCEGGEVFFSTACSGDNPCPDYYAGVLQLPDEIRCPNGYRNGGTGITERDMCSKTVDATYCANLGQCSNFKNIVTTGNNACSVSINNNNSSIVNGSVLWGSRNTDQLCSVTKNCVSGYSPTNIYAWLAEHPESVSGAFSYCPQVSPISESNQDSTYNCTDNEAGTFALTLTGADRPMDKLHFITKCSSTPFDFENPASQIATSISDTGGGYCWVKVFDFPNQPWIGSAISYYNINGENVLSEQACSHSCGQHAFVPISPDYMFGTMQNGNFVLNENYRGVMLMLPVFASMTDGQNGNPSADVCVASTVNINWGTDANNQEITSTCTYGENNYYQAPSTIPAADQGYKFIGWKVSVTGNNE